MENKSILKRVIKVAIADGILTPNEQKVIEEVCLEEGFDFVEVIKDVKKQISELNIDKETELINYNKKNGDDFEKFIVQKFDKKYFRIKEWAGDKYINGVYAETTLHPDLLIEFGFNKDKFSIECKWRKELSEEGVFFIDNTQLKRYRLFEKKQKIPVFLAVGIGEKGISPNQLFIIPLKEINNNILFLKNIKRYVKNIDDNFFFDINTKKLR